MQNQTQQLPHSDSTQGSDSDIMPVDKSGLPLPADLVKHEIAERVAQQFRKLHTRFIEDVNELTEEMGGEQHFKINVGPRGLNDVSLYFEY